MGVASFDLSRLQDEPTLESLEANILEDGKERGKLSFDLSFYPVLKPEKVDGKEQPMPDSSKCLFRKPFGLSLTVILQRLELYD